MAKKTVKKDTSYGVIPLRRQGDQWQVLLIQHGAGHWSFPKGHIDEGEAPIDCAIRELFEETQLSVVRFLLDRKFMESYMFSHEGTLISKTVVYYAAEVTGEAVFQPEELQDCRWLSLSEARELITFPAARKVLDDLVDLL
ncbi:MAG: NUDIX domain-containing protein [Chlamydiales bacterium]|nr:NUDIX domain-containing protein [Chlamydiales bacterium]